MEFRVLGPLEVVDDGRDVTPSRPKQRALLALLLLRAGEVVSSDEAIEALWSEPLPRAARNALQGHVAALRKLVGADRIETRSGGYVLRLDEDELDLHRFERLVANAQREDPSDKATSLADALALFRGAPLADFRYESFASTEAARIEGVRLLAHENRIDADLELGRHAQLVPELERLVAEAPLRERLRRQLVLALYRSGRQADALEAYQRARRELVDELGIEPGPELQRLERQILNQDPDLDVRVVAAPRLQPELPMPLTPLLGRDRELREVREILLDGDVRFVTLTGPGGTGKTRLALELARDALRDFPGGTFFVPLAPLADPSLVLPTIAHAMGVRETAEQPLRQTLAARVTEGNVLVVLDNFEHLLAAAPTIAELPASVPALTVLVTSRATLRVDGEHVYRVPPLDERAASALFVERALSVRLDLDRGDTTAQAITEICRRLDNLPLAIELAAARTTLFPPSALLARLGERFALLMAGARDRPKRQQTLRRTLEWSYELLDDAERKLFARVAVFGGGWTLDAAERVCGDDLDVVEGLASLIDKSMLQLDATVDEPRLAMLETIREYSLERLAETGEEHVIRDRHLTYFLDVAESAYGERRTPATADVLSRLERENDNLRVAADWAALTDPPRELELVGALGWYWGLRSHLLEGEARLAAALARSPDRSAARARALIGAAADIAFRRGRPDATIALAAEALELSRELGDDENTSHALDTLGWGHCVRGDHDAALVYFEQALDMRRRLGDAGLMQRSLLAVCQIRVIKGDVDEAEPIGEALYREAVESGDHRPQVLALHLLADCALIRCDYEMSEQRYARAVVFSWADGVRVAAAEEMQGVALSASGQGDYTRALRLAGAAEAEWERLGAGYRYAFWVQLVERHLGRARAALGPEASEAAWQLGWSTPFEEAVEDSTRSLRHSATAVSGA